MSKNLNIGDSGDIMNDTIIEDITNSPYIHAGIII